MAALLSNMFADEANPFGPQTVLIWFTELSVANIKARNLYLLIRIYFYQDLLEDKDALLIENRMHVSLLKEIEKQRNNTIT